MRIFHFFRKISLLLFLLNSVRLAVVANEPYAVLSGEDSDQTLTFYYGEKTESAFSIAESYDYAYERAWDDFAKNIKTVVFDDTFTDYYPLSTAYWFSGFQNMTELVNLENFNTSHVTNMEQMFEKCKSITTLDVSHFDTSNVTTMEKMFRYCHSLASLNLSSFDTMNVTTMQQMFYGCDNLTSLDLSSFRTEKVKSMRDMFLGCTRLVSLNLSSFDTSNVSSMQGMFYDCQLIETLDLSTFNTGKVSSMQEMFHNCGNLISLDLSSFDTSKVRTMLGMFSGCVNLKTIIVEDTWNTENVQSAHDMFRNCRSLVGCRGTTYSLDHTELDYAHIDGGVDNPGYLSVVREDKPYALLDGSTLTFYYGFAPDGAFELAEHYEKGDDRAWAAVSSNVKTVVFDESFAVFRPISTARWFQNFRNMTAIANIENLNTCDVTNMSGMFANDSSLPELDVSHFDTGNVTDMGGMFSGCWKLTTIDLANFNTANVETMNTMFSSCVGMDNLDLSSFDTGNVTDMYGMFSECSNLSSLDISNFNTANVTNMSFMFSGCVHLASLNLSHFDTGKVESMISMFGNCNLLASVDVSLFNTSSVTSMWYMFGDCTSLTSLDLSNFKTDNVVNMERMFNACTNLATIYVGSEWSTGKVTESEDMFYNCQKLVGGKGTKFISSHIDKTYARIDGGADSPGYLTGKALPVPYAVLNGSTLTFYFDGNMPKGAYKVEELYPDYRHEPAWQSPASLRGSIKTVEFNESFSSYRPTSTAFWFNGMYGLKNIVGIEYLNTTNVTNMERMFWNCAGLTTLDLSNFDTHNVTNMMLLFAACYKLETIYVGSKWSTSMVSNGNNMFSECKSLVGGQGTRYADSPHDGVSYAHVDGGVNNPGYLTEKNVVGINVLEQLPLNCKKSVSWYMLDGIKLKSTPNQSGIYVKEGRKFFLKGTK